MSESAPIDHVVHEFFSHLVGIAFGRWSAPNYGVDTASESFTKMPFGALTDPAIIGASIAADGILVEDRGHPSDGVRACRAAVAQCWPSCDLDEVWTQIESVFGQDQNPVRTWIRSGFFDFHIGRYSKSRRRAPIYWQLATPSASYSLWLYYHRLTRDTLYRALNDYATPKLKYEERKLTSLTQDAGPNPSASQRKEINAQDSFVAELGAFLGEAARVAPLWNPDLNDGVIINFAPLWRLVPQNRSWQKECKKVWDKLVAGEYDWAHLAMHLWPERVVPRCAKDRSLAITHGLEEVFWEEDDDGKWQPRKVSRDIVERIVEAGTSAAVKSALDDLLRAPAPTTSPRGRRGGGRRRRSANGRITTASRRNAQATESLVNKGTVEAVKEAIAAAGDGATKSDVMNAIGLSSGEWNASINALLAQGVATKSGAARGTRYYLAEKEEGA